MKSWLHLFLTAAILLVFILVSKIWRRRKGSSGADSLGWVGDTDGSHGNHSHDGGSDSGGGSDGGGSDGGGGSD